jgi:hypothetical protein
MERVSPCQSYCLDMVLFQPIHCLFGNRPLTRTVLLEIMIQSKAFVALLPPPSGLQVMSLASTPQISVGLCQICYCRQLTLTIYPGLQPPALPYLKIGGSHTITSFHLRSLLFPSRYYGSILMGNESSCCLLLTPVVLLPSLHLSLGISMLSPSRTSHLDAPTQYSFDSYLRRHPVRRLPTMRQGRFLGRLVRLSIASAEASFLLTYCNLFFSSHPPRYSFETCGGLSN